MKIKLINSSLEFLKKEEIIVSTTTIFNGGAGNSYNQYKVRCLTLGLDGEKVKKIVIVTNRPVTKGNTYFAEFKAWVEEGAIGQDCNGDTTHGNTIISVPSPYNTVFDAKTEIPVPANCKAITIALEEKDPSGIEIALRTTDFNGYYIGYKIVG